MKLENYYERIDQYHAGELSTDARASYEQDLKGNTELRQADELYRLSLSALDYEVEESLRKDLKKWSAEDKRTTGGRVVSMRRMVFVLGVAAAVALFVFFALPFLMPAPSATELYTAYYETPSESSMRGGSVPENALTAAKKALAEESYADAVEDFSRIPMGDPLYVEAQYYLGHALLGLNNPTGAQKAFEVAANSTEVKFKDKGEWYAIMAQLKAGRLDDVVKSRLETIAQNGNHSYVVQAREILKKMK